MRRQQGTRAPYHSRSITFAASPKPRNRGADLDGCERTRSARCVTAMRLARTDVCEASTSIDRKIIFCVLADGHSTGGHATGS
jgi:hypothetical protein